MYCGRQFCPPLPPPHTAIPMAGAVASSMTRKHDSLAVIVLKMMRLTENQMALTRKPEKDASGDGYGSLFSVTSRQIERRLRS